MFYLKLHKDIPVQTLQQRMNTQGALLYFIRAAKLEKQPSLR